MRTLESDFSGFVPKDLREVTIDPFKAPDEKQEEFLRQTGSNIIHSVDETTVICEYGDKSLHRILADLIRPE